MKRVFVSLPDGVWKIIDKDFKKRMGDSESEIVRNIVISYLSTRGYFVNSKGYEDTAEIKDTMAIIRNMIVSVIELLEEKGLIAPAEWENKMKRIIRESTS